MKKILLMAIATVLVLSVAGGAFAAGSVAPTVGVAGTVNGKCTIATTPGDIAFTIDPDLAGPFNAVVGTQPVIKCTKNHPYTVACTSLNTFNLMQGADSIPYTFTCPAGSNGAGFGAGGGIALAIGGQVSAGYADAPVGSGYADTVTITVNY